MNPGSTSSSPEASHLDIEIVLETNNTEHMAWVEEIENKFDELLPGKKKSAHWCPVKPPRTSHGRR